MMGPFWGLSIVGVIALIQIAGARGTPGRFASDAPFDILERRYAHGELAKE